MEHEARFERIQATLETPAKAQLRGEYTLTDAIGNMARSHKQLLASQVLIADAQEKTEKQIGALAEAMAALAAAQAKSDLAQAETQGKFDALIHMWDESIRERGGRNGRTGTEPPPNTPPAS